MFYLYTRILAVYHFKYSVVSSANILAVNVFQINLRNLINRIRFETDLICRVLLVFDIQRTVHRDLFL
jgi:hypothetical protein